MSSLDACTNEVRLLNNNHICLKERMRDGCTKPHLGQLRLNPQNIMLKPVPSLSMTAVLQSSSPCHDNVFMLTRQ